MEGVQIVRDLNQCRRSLRGDRRDLLKTLAARHRVHLFEAARPSLHVHLIRIAGPAPGERAMRKTWLVALTEYSNAVRSKAFIHPGVLALPVLILPERRLHVFRPEECGHPRTALRRRGPDGCALPGDRGEGGGAKREVRHTTRRGWQECADVPKVSPELFDPAGTGGGNADVVLSERVRREELTGFVIYQHKRAFRRTAARRTGCRGSRKTHTYSELPDWLERTINEEFAGCVSRRPAWTRRWSAS